MQDEEKSVHEIIRQAETNYIWLTTKLGEYVDWSMYQTVEKVSAYLNSRHISGKTDSLGREKPFFNIVTAAVNIWYRATEVERKDIVIRPTKTADVAATFLATIMLQDWMRRERFGVFLQQWGRALAQYGSAVVKFVERNGKLIPSVISWNRIITDPVDFDALPRIEKYYKTADKLKAMATPGDPSYIDGIDQDEVERLIIAAQSTRKTMMGVNQDNKRYFIELYEVHGNLPLSLLTGESADKHTYRQQMHIVSFVQNKSGEYDDFTLYKGKEAKDPYMITHLIAEDGRTLAIGAVEHLFDSQWMQNHIAKNIKDTLDLSSKLIFQTADQGFVGRNALIAIESGDILVWDKVNGSELTKVDTSKVDITSLQNFAQQWKDLAEDITSTPESLRGQTLPAGTPYALGSLMAQQGGSLFQVMQENKGLALEDMLRDFIIPHLKKKLNHKKEIVAVLEDHHVTQLDAMYIPKEAIRRHNEQAKEDVLSGKIPQPFNQQEAQQNVQSELAPLGNTRFFTPEDVNWSEALKDIEWDVDVGVTNESADKQVVLQTLSTVLQSIASNPAILQDPNAKMLFGKILDFTGVVSPIELSAAAAQQPPAQQQGQPAQPGQPGQQPGQPNVPVPSIQNLKPTRTPIAGFGGR